MNKMENQIKEVLSQEFSYNTDVATLPEVSELNNKSERELVSILEELDGIFRSYEMEKSYLKNIKTTPLTTIIIMRKIFFNIKRK